MNPLSVQAAAELTQMINGHSFQHAPEALQAVRAYRPVKDLDSINELLVTVAPNAQETEPETRGSDRHDVTIMVAVQRKVANPDDVAEVDALMAFVEEMRGFLNRRDLPDTGAKFRRTTIDPIYHPGHLRRLGLFTSMIGATYLTIGAVT